MAVYQQSSHILKLYNSRKIILDQLEVQGFDVSNYNDFSINEVHIMNTNKQVDMLLTDANGKKVYIKYFLGKSLRPQNIHDIIDDLFNLEGILEKRDMLIIITKDKSSRDTLIAEVKQIWAENGIYLNIIDIMSLQYNVLDHEMVPKHIKLNNDEITELKKRYNIVDDSCLPEISRLDPVAMAIGLRPGEICKIERSSITAIDGIYYRFCINN